MKRFIFICVALISFAATNASGTGYQPTVELQAHYQATHPIVLMPVLNVIDFTFETIGQNVVLLNSVVESVVVQMCNCIAYHNPDYGSRHLNYSDIRYNLRYSNHKLPTQFVQLE